MRKTLTLIALLLIMTVSILPMTSCASSATTATTAATTAATTKAATTAASGAATTAASGGTLKLGLVAPITGTNKLVGEYMTNGMNLALEQINAAGGILGKKVEAVVSDEVDNLQDSVNATQRLLANKDVTAIVGSLYSTYCIAALPDVLNAKVPFFSSGSSSGVSKAKNPYTWQVRPIDTFQGVTLANFAVNTLKMKKPAIMYSTQSALQSLQEQVVAALKNLGVSITEKNLFGFPDEETNYAPYFSQILAGGYDGIISLTNQMPAALVCKQAEIAGIDPNKMPLLGSTSYCSNVCITNAGAAANGWYSVADWIPGGANATGAAFEKAYVAKYGKASDLPAVSAYDAVMVIKKACEIANSTDREAINNAIPKIKALPGAISTFSYFEDHCFATALGITQNKNKVPTMISSVTFRQP